jgi:hypothetical protein
MIVNRKHDISASHSGGDVCVVEPCGLLGIHQQVASVFKKEGLVEIKIMKV